MNINTNKNTKRKEMTVGRQVRYSIEKNSMNTMECMPYCPITINS